MLTTFWLPMINFDNIIDNFENINESSSNEIRKISFSENNINIIIDSLGFYYFEGNKEDIDSFIQQNIDKLITSRTKDILENTFLHKELLCNDGIDFQLSSFIDSIKKEIENIEDIKLLFIKYKIKDEEVTDFKFEANSSSDLKKIIDRDFKSLLKKSILYTNDFSFEINEVYDLDILKKINYDSIVKDLELNLVPKTNSNIIEGVIKKAIQDTIEEITLLNFLEKTKKRYIVKIYDKIEIANTQIKKVQSQILAIDNFSSSANIKNCDIENEEHLEQFIEVILQAIPHFKVIDTKIKNAYYIKIGNVTTETFISNQETIENTLFYQKWKSAIDYFEEMTYQLKEVIFIYHQNKNIKELEDISYYENYKSDLEDIRNIQYNDIQNSGIFAEQKSLIERYALAIAAFALAGEAPIINPSWLKIFKDAKDLTLLDSFFPYAIESFLITAINVIIYLLIFALIFVKFRKQTKWIYNLFKKPFLPKNSIDKKSFFFFDPTDYDKHEHRSTKLLINEIIKDSKIDYEPIKIEYNEVQSAYELLKRIKSCKISKIVSNHVIGQKKYQYNIFPSILIGAYSNDFNIRENYRILRIDKITTKILFRYKITNLSLDDFLNTLNKDNFNEYYNKIAQISNSNYISNYIKNIQESFKNEKIDKDIFLNLYIVYSFILKLDNSNSSMYSYTIQKDQFRIHYHINRLPKNNLDNTLDSLANLIHIYFLARFKNFRYLHR